MLHEAPNVKATGPGGFIGIEQAEQFRRDTTSADFRKQYPQEYERAVRAAVAVRRAEQELVAAKESIKSLSTPIKVGDLIDAIQADAAGQLSKVAHPSTENVRAPDGVPSGLGVKARKASTRLDGGSAAELVDTSETVPAYS
jgi:hypothetical protein